MTSQKISAATVAHLSDLPEDSMRMANVDGHRIVVIRTKTGVHALDNACPHQGYGLATGALSVGDDGEGLVTCQWHNWKFRASDGVCIQGEENVACHQVDIADDGAVSVTVTEPSDDDARAALWPSLRSGLERDYRGQVSRDAIRLLRAGATPAELVGTAVMYAAGRNEYGPGHEVAMAADCLHLAEMWSGDERALSVVQALSGISESCRARPERPIPAADGSIDVGAAIENEDVDGAMRWAAAASDRDVATVRHRIIEAVSRHHLDYGHGAIYTQKAFELLDAVGWEHASNLLPHLAAGIAWGTREDTLPYMRTATRAIHAVDLDSLAATAGRPDTGWDPTDFVETLLDASDAPIEAAIRAAHDGAGVVGLIDAVSLAASQRLLRHDLDLEMNSGDPFGWLDISHALTYANAARWAWTVDPGPHTARLALFTVWLAHDSGRGERRNGVSIPDAQPELVERALVADSTGIDGIDGISEVGDELAQAALDDRAGSFIVLAHLVKTAQAARVEAEAVGSSLPLAAAARLIASPRRERFVARNVTESLRFVETGRPPIR